MGLHVRDVCFRDQLVSVLARWRGEKGTTEDTCD